MFVLKRGGRREPVAFDKITSRIHKLSYGLNSQYVDSVEIAQKVISGLYPSITTVELDNLAAETAAYLTVKHPDYAILAARIAISNLHKQTKKSFSAVIEDLYNWVNPKTGKHSPIIAKETRDIVAANAEVLDSAIIYDRDFHYNYFGFKTLERAYLLRIDGKVVERPAQMLMRVAVGIHGQDIESAIESYHLMSQKYFTHASPTLFNSGTPHPQLSSCYLVSMKEDSIDGIYNTLKTCALISKTAGGIGVNIHDIRASGSYIAGTGGSSNGLVPMLRVFNNTARYVDQCFSPETIVYSKEGPKKIKDITTSDSLLNAKGNYDDVDQLLHHDYEGKVLEFKVGQDRNPVQVTDMHQILVLRMEDANSSNKNPTMINSKDIRIGDFICFPQMAPDAMEDKINFSDEDLQFYGCLVAVGDIDEETSSVMLPKDEKERIFILDYLHNRGIQYSIVLRQNGEEVSWKTSSLNFKFRPSQLYIPSVEPSRIMYERPRRKRIHPNFLNLPLSKTKSLLLGILGNIIRSHDYSKFICEHDLYMLTLPSPEIAENLNWLLYRYGFTSSFESIVDGGALGKNQIMFSLDDYNKITSNAGDKESAAFTYRKILSIKEIDYRGLLYDFEVSGDHTYVTSMGICHNGGNKRPGAFAMYLETWHADIFEFIELRKNHGKEEVRARDLFYALWISDLFMRRVEANQDWSLMCPHECPGLADCWGEEFENLYEKYERDGKARVAIPAQKLWRAIIESQIETGGPFMLYKDACNRKSNQQNLGTIKSSNLCTEIIEYSSPEEVAVCNLASIALPSFIRNDEFDFELLKKVTKHVTRNLNKIIDINYYPVPEAKRSNFRHRPIGIGVQGLADAFMKLRMPFESIEARVLNKQIFETIYYGAVEASCDLAKVESPYETYEGSPMSQGIFQYDMWNVTPTDLWDWSSLKSKVAKHGIRNSLLVAPMPTASTSQILGFNECFEAYTSNIYVRRVISGEFQIVNQHLLKDLSRLGKWNNKIKDEILANNGSIQTLIDVPEDIKKLYKTVWEISQKTVIDLAADRGAFIDQSQSLNIHISEPSYGRLSSMHFYGWKKGLKTGMYYLRSQPAAKPIQFTVDTSSLASSKSTTLDNDNNNENSNTKTSKENEVLMCSLENKENCLMCSG